MDEIKREERCSLMTVRRIAAMLDIDPDQFKEGDALPPGWQFVLMGADTPRSTLRSDGFPGLGVPMPDLGLPRLMLAGRTVEFIRDIPIGALIERRSKVLEVREKTTKSGPMAVVQISHQLFFNRADAPALNETQTYLLMPKAKHTSTSTPDLSNAAPPGDQTMIVTPDATMLFQYSALGFNSHKIHIDRAYAQEVEGFPDLVVNGGLATLLMTEFLRQRLRLKPNILRTRHMAPLYCDRPMLITSEMLDSNLKLRAYDAHHTLALEMEVTPNEL